MIIALTQATPQSQEIETIQSMLNCGLDRIHLRREGSNLTHFQKEAEEFYQLFGSKLSVHGPIAGPWAHHRKSQSSWSEIQTDSTQSASCHTWSDVEMENSCEYVFLSPVFNSISKVGYSASSQLHEWQTLLTQKERAFKPKIIALGGVHLHNLSQVHTMGFDGIALLGAIWQSPNPLAEFLAIQKKWFELTSNDTV